MNNFIEYFYNIKTNKITFNEKYYSFIYNGYVYKLYVYNIDSNTNTMMEINKQLTNNTLISEIIKNRNNEIVSIDRNVGYILIKIYVNISKAISLDEIIYLSKALSKKKLNINWGMLWERKIDYLEDLINENGKRYPLLVDSFNYFVGMAENAISYYNNVVIDEDYNYVISHKNIRFSDTVEALYNPLNIIFDYRVRDVAEYIKFAFFNNRETIFNELDLYLKNSNLSQMEVKLLIARLLYPSFYFDMYEDILIDEKEEKIITKIIARLDEYEIYLGNIITNLAYIYKVDDISWLKKTHN